MQDIVYVVAKMQARPDKVETLRKIIEQGVEGTRKEKGCVRYSLMQDRQNPLVLTLLEEWETNVDLDTHLSQPRLQEIFAQLPEMLSAPPEITRYRKLA